MKRAFCVGACRSLVFSSAGVGGGPPPRGGGADAPRPACGAVPAPRLVAVCVSGGRGLVCPGLGRRDGARRPPRGLLPRRGSEGWPPALLLKMGTRVFSRANKRYIISPGISPWAGVFFFARAGCGIVHKNAVDRIPDRCYYRDDGGTHHHIGIQSPWKGSRRERIY